MAAAQTPLPIEQESAMLTAQQHASTANCAPMTRKQTISPVLVVILIAMVLFPFIVGVLPTPVIRHLDALFH